MRNLDSVPTPIRVVMPSGSEMLIYSSADALSALSTGNISQDLRDRLVGLIDDSNHASRALRGGNIREDLQGQLVERIDNSSDASWALGDGHVRSDLQDRLIGLIGSSLGASLALGSGNIKVDLQDRLVGLIDDSNHASRALRGGNIREDLQGQLVERIDSSSDAFYALSRGGIISSEIANLINCLSVFDKIRLLNKSLSEILIAKKLGQIQHGFFSEGIISNIFKYVGTVSDITASLSQDSVGVILRHHVAKELYAGLDLTNAEGREELLARSKNLIHSGLDKEALHILLEVGSNAGQKHVVQEVWREIEHQLADVERKVPGCLTTFV